MLRTLLDARLSHRSEYPLAWSSADGGLRRQARNTRIRDKVSKLVVYSTPILVLDRAAFRLRAPRKGYCTMRNRPNTPRVLVGPRPAGSRIITVNIVIKLPFCYKNQQEHEVAFHLAFRYFNETA